MRPLPHSEIAPAPRRDPDTARIPAPGFALDATRVGDLSLQPCPARGRVAAMRAAVVGLAADRVGRALITARLVVVAILRSTAEFGTATVVHPYPLRLRTPGSVLDAGRIRELAQEHRATAHVAAAEAVMAVVGFATDGAFGPRLLTVGCGDRELRTAAMVDP